MVGRSSLILTFWLSSETPESSGCLAFMEFLPYTRYYAEAGECRDRGSMRIPRYIAKYSSESGAHQNRNSFLSVASPLSSRVIVRQGKQFGFVTLQNSPRPSNRTESGRGSGTPRPTAHWGKSSQDAPHKFLPPAGVTREVCLSPETQRGKVAD